MIEREAIDKYDSHGMCKAYDQWSQIAQNSYNTNSPPLDLDGITHVVFAGMGGSGTVSDIFSALCSQNNTHITIVKGYTLPKTIDENTLVVAISVSGNTDETLSVLKSSLNHNCKRVAFSTGGIIEKFSHDNNIDHYSCPLYLNPRASLPSILYTVLKILGTTLSVDESMIKNSLFSLSDMTKNISSNNLTEQNSAIRLASQISKMPIIYYPRGLESIAIRFKNSIHENMKMHATAENIIEMCHNQITVLEHTPNIRPFLLQGTNDHPKTIERWTILKEILEEQNIEYVDLPVTGNNILSKIICAIYKSDYSTIYGAVMNHIDPFNIKSIQYVKSRLP